MIVKLRQDVPWRVYKKRSSLVKALRINEDFLYETRVHGWVQGHKGQWLVELGENLRCNLDHESFLRTYKPTKRVKED